MILVGLVFGAACKKSEEVNNNDYAAQLEPFEKAAFEGKTGEVYPEIVETRFGFHVIKVEDKKEENYIPFEDVAEQLREETLNQMRLDGYNEAVEDLEMKYEV